VVQSNGKSKRKSKTKGLIEREQIKVGEMPEIPVDTQDVVAMYRVAHESIARAREGGGPTRIVGVRWAVTVRGRKGASVKAESEDAVTRLEQWLTARGLPAQEWRREIVAEFEARRGKRDFGAQDQGAGVVESAKTRAIA
jgi:TPP-dependent pyruvate/acetoin dehydrogenase alpha subunit